MKKFIEFIAEEKESEEPVEFFAHYRSGKDKNHSIEDSEYHDLKEGFEHTSSEERKIFAQNKENVKHHNKIKVSKEQLSAINSYNSNSRKINNALMNKKSKLNSSQKQNLNHLDSVLNNPENKLKQPVHAYSGISENFHKTLSKVKPGKTVHSPAYISTSLKREVAQEYGNKYPTEGYHIHFHLPKNYSKGRYIDKHSLHTNEHEFLLSRGQKFKYVGKSEHKDKENMRHIVHHLEPID